MNIGHKETFILLVFAIICMLFGLWLGREVTKTTNFTPATGQQWVCMQAKTFNEILSCKPYEKTVTVDGKEYYVTDDELRLTSQYGLFTINQVK